MQQANVVVAVEEIVWMSLHMSHAWGVFRTHVSSSSFSLARLL